MKEINPNQYQQNDIDYFQHAIQRNILERERERKRVRDRDR